MLLKELSHQPIVHLGNEIVGSADFYFYLNNDKLEEYSTKGTVDFENLCLNQHC